MTIRQVVDEIVKADLPVETNEQVNELVHQDTIRQDLCCVPLCDNLRRPHHPSMQLLTSADQTKLSSKHAPLDLLAFPLALWALKPTTESGSQQ